MTTFKFNKPTLITLTAPTCSGKSYLLDELTRRGLITRIVSTTTRQQRLGETAGVDYDYISVEKSNQMEANGEFFELIEFNGVRYGVTQAEMKRSMANAQPPIVILEPKGLDIYKQKCKENGWDIFKVYVHVTESVRLERLLQRTLSAAWTAVDTLNPSPGRYTQAFFDVSADAAKKSLASVINEHHRRVLSITGDERAWSHRFSWDAIVPGDNVESAIQMIAQGCRWRNRKYEEPRAVPTP